MICKKDVILWFKELESYRRIDTMCTLLNMCLPFELRFLGTCLEELGRRDSQELRGMELRVNNPQDLATDMIACQKGEPTDKKIRRKMALYLALIRACNRNCVAEIFRTLDGWGERDFQCMTDAETLQELLLVYTLAANHPVFSFEQHIKCTEIFEQIKDNKLVSDETAAQSPPAIAQIAAQQHQLLTEQTLVAQQQQQHHQASQHEQIYHQQQQAAAAMHSTRQHPPPSVLAAAPGIQLLPQFTQTHLAKFLPTSDGSLPPHTLSVDGMPHMLWSDMSIPPPDANALLATHNNAWSPRPFPVAQMESSSPSSPSNSRNPSPNRAPPPQQQQQPSQQQQLRQLTQRMTSGSAGGGSSSNVKHMRRPSVEMTTPPPVITQQQSQQQQQMMSNDMILAPQIGLKHLDDVVLNNSGDNTPAAGAPGGNQLHTLIRNGYTRYTHARSKGAPPANAYMPAVHQQQQQPQHTNQTSVQQQQQQHYQAGSGGNYAGALVYSMQSLSLAPTTSASTTADMDAQKSGGSESGNSVGSSIGDSPPETPALLNAASVQNAIGQQHQQKHHQPTPLSYNSKQLSQMRANGRPDKLLSPAMATNSNVYVSPGTQSVGGQQQNPQQQQLYAVEMQALANNNGGAGTNIVPVSSQNNNNTTVLISSPSAVGGIMPKYYHAGAGARPPSLMAHNANMVPPPSGHYRISGFPLGATPNGDIIYSTYAGIPFLASGTAPPPPGVQPVSLRSANSASGAPPPPQQQQQMQPTSLPNAAGGLLTAAPPYSALTVGVVALNKPMSCYNCGSQTHTGRDCQEASMDDVTRSAIYKLDYSVSAMSPTTSVGAALEATTASVHHSKQHSIDGSSSNSSSSSTAGGGSASTSNAGLTSSMTALNTK